MRLKIISLLLFISINSLFAQSDLDIKVIGSAHLENKGYDLLRNICDRFGGRLAGSKANELSVEYLIEELKKLSIEVKTQDFEMPVWNRADDYAELIAPYSKKMNALSLGYVVKSPEIISEVFSISNKSFEDFAKIDLSNKILLAKRSKAGRGETIKFAKSKGASAVLFAEEKGDGILTVGVANFTGEPAETPAFIISKEDAEQLQRMLDNNIIPKLRLKVNSETKKGIVKNVIATIKGKSNEKIVIGAHFDSWDISQGAEDNGSGSAILFDIARLIKKYSPLNERTIEFVWFNAEESGLWGSKQYVAANKEDVLAMINLDMPGSPRGINAMGYESFTPLFSKFIDRFKQMDMRDGITQNPWLNSDHQPFMMEGIPAFTITGYLDKEIYYNYHSFNDTFDKIVKRYLSDCAGFTALLGIELANADATYFKKLNPKEVDEHLKKYNLYEKARK